MRKTPKEKEVLRMALAGTWGEDAGVIFYDREP